MLLIMKILYRKFIYSRLHCFLYKITCFGCKLSVGFLIFYAKNNNLKNNTQIILEFNLNFFIELCKTDVFFVWCQSLRIIIFNNFIVCQVAKRKLVKRKVYITMCLERVSLSWKKCLAWIWETRSDSWYVCIFNSL